MTGFRRRLWPRPSTELRERGVVQLPATAWDTSTSPPLPRSVTVPLARQADRRHPWTRFPWCSELGWVASLTTLTDARFNELVAINTWLARNRGDPTPMLPMRYRSAQVFGDEKRLETMARTALFGPGRLSMELLACQRIPPPLAAAKVGSGPDVLVSENSDPYWMAIEALRTEAAHSVGLVVWGAGKSFPTQIPTLNVDVAGHGPAQGTVWYWGDLDPDGLAIAVEAANVATIVGGPRNPARNPTVGGNGRRSRAKCRKCRLASRGWATLAGHGTVQPARHGPPGTRPRRPGVGSPERHR